MHFLKYVGVIILFLFYTVHVDQVWLSNVPMCPAPCPSDHFNLLYSSAALPPSSHQVQKRYQRYREERPCAYGQTGHFWRSYPSGSLYKQPQLTVNSVVPLEFWKSTPPSLQFWLLHCNFFLLYYSIEVSLSRFSILLLFWLSLTFSNAIGPMGHSSPFWVQGICPPYPTRCTIGYLTCGKRLFYAKH